VLWAFWAVLVGFFAVWALRATVLFGVDLAIAEGLPRRLYSEAVKALVWGGSAIAYLRWVRRAPIVSSLKLTTSAPLRAWTLPLAVSALYLAGCAADVAHKHGAAAGLLLSALGERGPLLFASALFSSFVEELFFRGFVLDELSRRARFSWANLGTSALFVAVHLPYWLWTRGASAVVAWDAAGVFGLSLVLGFVVYRTRSLWPAVGVHALSNALNAALG
jgi:membrane protease YdiL (CAAX protease family)